MASMWRALLRLGHSACGKSANPTIHDAEDSTHLADGRKRDGSTSNNGQNVEDRSSFESTALPLDSEHCATERVGGKSSVHFLDPRSPAAQKGIQLSMRSASLPKETTRSVDTASLFGGQLSADRRIDSSDDESVPMAKLRLSRSFSASRGMWGPPVCIDHRIQDVLGEVGPSFSRRGEALNAGAPAKPKISDLAASRDLGGNDLRSNSDSYDLKSLRDRQRRHSAILSDQEALSYRQSDLIHQVLPPSVAEALKEDQQLEPEQFDNVTIFQSDIVGFTKLASQLEAREVYALLDNLYREFDKLADKYELYKIETIGDAYICVGGLPKTQIDQVRNVVAFAVEAVRVASETSVSTREGTKTIQIRAGIHSGSILACVTSSMNPRYSLIGETLQWAQTLEQAATPMTAKISLHTHRLLEAQCVCSIPYELADPAVVNGRGSLQCVSIDPTNQALIDITRQDFPLSHLSPTISPSTRRLRLSAGEMKKKTSEADMKPLRRHTVVNMSRESLPDLEAISPGSISPDSSVRNQPSFLTASSPPCSSQKKTPQSIHAHLKGPSVSPGPSHDTRDSCKKIENSLESLPDISKDISIGTTNLFAIPDSKELLCGVTYQQGCGSVRELYMEPDDDDEGTAAEVNIRGVDTGYTLPSPARKSRFGPESNKGGQDEDIPVMRRKTAHRAPCRAKSTIGFARSSAIPSINRDRDLLNKMLPQEVAATLMRGEKVEPKELSDVSIIFCGIPDYREIELVLPPEKTHSMLQRLFHKLDRIVHKFGLYKVETVADEYVVAGNLMNQSPTHVLQACGFVLDALRAARTVMVDTGDESKGCVSIRAGIHIGTVIASVVGTLTPRYCLFGDAMNMASRMKSTAEPDSVTLSPKMANAATLNGESALEVTSLGMKSIKGKGMIECFRLMDTEANRIVIRDTLRLDEFSSAGSSSSSLVGLRSSGSLPEALMHV